MIAFGSDIVTGNAYLLNLVILLCEMKLKKIFFSAARPAAWYRQIKRTCHYVTKSWYWSKLDKSYSEYLSLESDSEGTAVLVEGLWDNPNQFYRLRAFLEGLDPSKRQVLAAVVRNKRDRSVSTLKSLGFKKFYYIDDYPEIDSDRFAGQSLRDRHRKLVNLRSLTLTTGLPVFVVYDTVLKNKRIPTVNVEGDDYLAALADAARLDRFYSAILKELNLSAVVFSHPWKTEFAVMAWKSIQHNVAFFHLNGMYESMRIRAIKSVDDFLLPIEVCKYKDFRNLPNMVKEKLYQRGRDYLQTRGNTGNTDINETMAFSGIPTAEDLASNLKIPPSKHVCLICGHAWFDFPHAFGMANFRDFVDWFEVTLEVIAKKTDIVWLLKPHPTEEWYGGARMRDFASNLPSHVILLEEEVSTEAAQEFADSIVTVHGTIGMEAAARGKPVLCADKNPYLDWEFATTAQSRQQYIELLEGVNQLKQPSSQKMDEAATCLYLNVAPTDEEHGLIKLVADHEQPSLIFGNLLELCKKPNSIVEQGQKVRDWLNSDTRSFSVYHKIRAVKQLDIGNDNDKEV
ncbi:hypothetical protein [Thalassospira povalilytica]|uniref:Uncharacterized protein n=1 Tax=Thalassospira povalilytica TaxID=732237 RepID=A0A8I1M6U3_9PROT|nr:hypothetical protein [Thalassospira povalilytica]MBN8195904.1 hypothetical protein [Thalassospira povalilytica]